MYYAIFCYCVCAFNFMFCLAEFVNVGLLLEIEGDEDIAHAFNYQTAFKKLTPLHEDVSADDSFQTLEIVCGLLEEGVAAIFGPYSEENSDVVQSVCDSKDVPHIETRWNDKQQRGYTMINVHPFPATLGKAYVDLVKILKWNKYTIFYEDNEGLSRISSLIKLNNGQYDYTVITRHLDKHATGDYRPSLKDAWKSGHTHFVLDCNIENLDTILKQAQQIGLMTHIHRYIITNLDFHTIDLEPYKYSGTIITGIRLINPESEAVIEFALDIQEKRRQLNMTAISDRKKASESLRLQVALMADAVSLFSLAYDELNVPNKIISCGSSDTWEHGLSLIGYMKTNTTEGLTGMVKLDHQGFRSEFSLEVVELNETGVFKVGTWNPEVGVELMPKPTGSGDPNKDALRNKTFTVIIALTDPYAMLKESRSTLEGNDRFEGFGIDLIHELSILEGFNYSFIVREDKANGALNETTGKWSGMIGDVMYDVAHFAITDLTITAEREEAVDFTSPFMTLGISILYQKPSKAPPDFFSFAQPFAFEVWLWLGGAYFMVSLSLFVMGRLCPSEWTNPYPCIEEPEFYLNQFSLRNSFWFTIGSLMQQGTEIAPIAYSTRMLAGMWWFFTLIMVSSYTANLAACLALESLDIPFNNVHELVARAEKAGIKYGAKLNGATYNFFKKSDSEDFKKIAQYMEEYPEVMVKENKDGVERAEMEKYAFFMESISIEYETQRHCTLDQVNGLLDEKGYGIAMKKGSVYRIPLNTAMLKLQSSGKIQALKRKWWEERRGGGQCTGDAEDKASVPLNLKSVGGVFWVTVGGICIAIVLVFVEMTLHTMKVSIKHKTSFRENLLDELKFYFKFKGLVKEVKYRKDDSKSPADSEKSVRVRNTPAPYGFLPDITKSEVTQ